MRAMGYHTYAGGLAVGVAKYFELAGLGEHDGYGNEIKALNFPGVPLYATYAEWPKTRGRGDRSVPFVFSNPPCAIFSVASAGRSTAWHQDPRLQLWLDIVRLLPDAQPDVLAIESVLPAWTTGRSLIDRLAATAAGWGYSTTILLHNAKFLGAVQDRRRIFIIFHRIHAEWPEPDFSNYVTVRDILRGVRVPAATRRRYAAEAALSPERAKLYHRLTETGGTNLRKAFNDLFGEDAPRRPDGRTIGRPAFLTYRLKLDQPGPVFMGSGHILHPTEPRSLYPEEINAYTGFPPEWKWPDYGLAKLSTFASQGVSPLGGAWLGEGARGSIERGGRVNRPDYGVTDGLSPEGWARGRIVVSDDPADYAPAYTDAQMAGDADLGHAIYEEADMKKTQVALTPPKTGLPDKADGEGSGVYMRRLLALGADDASILERVHAQFPGSKATKSDVSYNKAKLKKEGAQPSAVVAKLPGKAPKYAAAPWEPTKPTGVPVPSPQIAVSALRAAVAKKATGGLAAMLTLSLDLMEKL